MILTWACPSYASSSGTFLAFYPVLNVFYGVLVLKIAGLKLNASNFHKFSLNWFWIAQFSVRCNMKLASLRSRRKTMVICFSLWLLRQVLLALILSHSSFQAEAHLLSLFMFITIAIIFFPKHHKHYDASPEIYFKLFVCILIRQRTEWQCQNTMRRQNRWRKQQLKALQNYRIFWWLECSNHNLHHPITPLLRVVGTFPLNPWL